MRTYKGGHLVPTAFCHHWDGNDKALLVSVPIMTKGPGDEVGGAAIIRHCRVAKEVTNFSLNF